MGGARSWGAAAVVAVVAAVAGPSVVGAAPADVATLATTLTGSRVPGGGDPHGLGEARVEVVDGTLCAELNVSATALPAAARLVGPSGAAVALPPLGADGRSSGCVDGVPTAVLADLAASPASFAVEIPGVVRGGLLPTAKEGTLLAARLGSMDGSGVATVAANPEAGRLCTEVPGGGRLRRLADGAVVAALPERGCVRGLGRHDVAAVAREPAGYAVETATGRGSLSMATELAGAAVPRFTPGPCPEVVPTDPRFTCGTLTVAEDRTDLAGPTVDLPVAVLRSASATPAPDPVVYFEGGPGYGAVEIADLFLQGDYGGDRDVILFDQRGTGGARPSLDCPEVDEATWEAFASTDPTEVELERTLAAYDACRRRLTDEGVDLDDYDTTTSADDAEDLRVALGVERWNLFGVSYGTTLALQTARAHPEAVRSVVVDSVYPTTESNAASAVVASADRAFDAVYEACAADPACAAAHPDLDGALAEIAARFDAAPHPTSTTHPLTGEEGPLLITGKDILSGLFQALYDAGFIPLVPSLLTDLRQGETAIIDVFVDLALPLLFGSAEGMAASVECSDRAAFPDDRDAVLADRPEWGTLVALGVWDCGRWAVDPADPGFNEPVTVDVPALVLAGEYDPITPPADSRAAADALPRSTYVELPGLGHGEVFAHGCPAAVFSSFLDDPTTTPDTSCVATMGPPAWVVG